MKQNKIPRNEYIRKPVGKTNPYKEDTIYTDMGQWKYPGQVTKIPSGDITMQGVPYPVYGQDNLGYSQMMYPGMDYQFPGQYVTEIPMAQDGLESRINNYLGNPLGRAQQMSTTNGKENDALRHAYASMYSSENAGPFIANALGLGHEIMGQPNSMKEHAGDIYNNFVGSMVGALPFVTTSTKEKAIKKLHELGLLSSGTKAYGGLHKAQDGQEFSDYQRPGPIASENPDDYLGWVGKNAEEESFPIRKNNKQVPRFLNVSNNQEPVYGLPAATTYTSGKEQNTVYHTNPQEWLRQNYLARKNAEKDLRLADFLMKASSYLPGTIGKIASAANLTKDLVEKDYTGAGLEAASFHPKYGPVFKAAGLLHDLNEANNKQAYGGDPSLPNIEGHYKTGGWLDQYQDAGQLRAATTYQGAHQNPVAYEQKVNAKVKQIDDKLKTSDKAFVVYDGTLYNNPYADPERNEFLMLDKSGSYVPSGVTPFDIVDVAQLHSAAKAASAANKGTKALSSKADSKFKSEIDWGKWNAETPNHPELINEYNAIEKAAKKDGTWMKYSDGTPFKGTPEQFIQMNSSHVEKFAGGKKAAEQMYKQDLHRGAHQHIDDFVNTDRSDYATFLTDSKANAESYAGSDGLSKSYYHPDVNTSGEWTDGIYQLGFPQNSPKVVGEAKGRNWRLLEYDDKIAKGTGSKDFAKRFQEELKDNRKLYDYNDYDPNKKYLSTDIYANYIKNTANPEGIAQINNVKDQMGFATNIPTNTVYAVDANRVPIKSLRHNVGFFDMTNPNIYKGVAPLGLGYLGYQGLQDEEYRRGGQRRRRGTSKNIESSINDIFRRNYDVFGPAGKSRFNPRARYEEGGWLDKYQDAGQLRAASTTAAVPVSTQAPINPVNPESTMGIVDFVKHRWNTRDQGPSDWNLLMMDKTGSYVDSGVTPFDLMLAAPQQVIKTATKAAKNLPIEKAAKKVLGDRAVNQIKTDVKTVSDNVKESIKQYKKIKQYNKTYSQELKDLPDLYKQALQDLNTPEGVRRLKELGVDNMDDFMKFAESASKKGTPLATTGYGPSFDNAGKKITEPFVNINFEQIDELRKKIPLVKTKSAIDHEYGHLITDYLRSKGKTYKGVTDLDIEAVEKLTPHVTSNITDMLKKVQFKTPKKSVIKNITTPSDTELPYYFFKGSKGEEPLAHLRETKRNMLDAGIIDNIHQTITPELLKMFRAATGRKDRMLSFLQNTPEAYKTLASLLNKTPALIPIGLGVGAAANQKKMGGWLDKYNNF